MSLRWRKNGELLCAAKHNEKPGDTYIGDRLQYQLAVEHKIIIPDINESLNGIHHWIKDVFPIAE